LGDERTMAILRTADRTTLVACATWLLAACAHASVSTPGTEARIARPGTQAGTVATHGGVAQMSPAPQVPAGSGMQRLVDQAVADLARRLSVPADHVALVSAAAVVWPDSSLGCPQPGMRYKQVPEDGARIVLEARGRTYAYHNGGSRGLFLCEKARATAKPKLPRLDITGPLPATRGDSVPPSPARNKPRDEDQ